MIQFRLATDGDAASLSALRGRVELADGVEAFSEFKAVDIERGLGPTVVGFDAMGIIAAGHAAFHHGDDAAPGHWAVEVIVDPEHRDNDVWQRVVTETVHALPAGARHVVWSSSGALAAAMRSLEYTPDRRLSRMERTLPTGFVAEFPAGVELAPFTPGEDEIAWLRVNNAAFAGHPENGGLTVEDLALRTSLEWFRSEDLLLAWEADTLVGSCWTKRHPDAVGEIYVIGVHPDHQGRGLGKALVIAGLEHLHDVAHARKGMLYVDHRSTAAMQLYEHLGFAEVRVTTMYVPAGGE